MCKECQRLIELYAETQLECVRTNKVVSKIITYECPVCGEKVFVVAQTVNDEPKYFFNDLPSEEVYYEEPKGESNDD